MLSVVIPVYNEEPVLESLIAGITGGLSELEELYEIILSENGSSDNTLALAHDIAQRYPQVVVISSPVASYGSAVKSGILHSRGEYIVIFNADLWDLEFLHEARQLMHTFDIVIASKRHTASDDRRPYNRRLITWGFNLLLRVMFGFTGTDTHGMKALRRQAILPVARQCITDREIFDTELILRSQQADLRITEVPTVVEETRPSRYSPFARVPRTFKDLWLLYRDMYLIRQKEVPVGVDDET